MFLPTARRISWLRFCINCRLPKAGNDDLHLGWLLDCRPEEANREIERDGATEYSGRSNVETERANQSHWGRGYTFADKVAAGFLAHMLKRKFPLEPDLGVIAELHFET